MTSTEPECGWLQESGTDRAGCVQPTGHFGGHEPTAPGTSTEPTAPTYRVEKQSYSRGAWRVLHAATGEQVFENGIFDHPTMGRIRLIGPVCFDRKRDAVAWVEAQSGPGGF